MRRSLVVFVVLLGMAFVLFGGPAYLFTWSSGEVAPPEEPDEDIEIVRPADGESGFWPYLNNQPTFQQRSPINVVVTGELETVLNVLTLARDANWEITTEEEMDADPGTHSLVDGRPDNATANYTETYNLSGDGNLTDQRNLIEQLHLIEQLNLTEQTNASEPGNLSEAIELLAYVNTMNHTDQEIDLDNVTVGTVTIDNVTVDNDTLVYPTGETANLTELTANATDGNLTAANRTVNTTAVDEGITIGGTRITWSQASGATRFAYVEAREGEGQWVEESVQIHDGDYYGYRYHIRLYESPNPDEPWVAMQAHSEHFDWFTLRHRVHGNQDAQSRIEADLMAAPHIDPTDDVTRVYLDNRRSDADGWATFVEMAAIIILVGLVGRHSLRRRVDTPDSGSAELSDAQLSDAMAGDTTSTDRGIGERIVYRLESQIGERLSHQYEALTNERVRIHLATFYERVKPRHLLLMGWIIGVILGVRVAGILLEGTAWLTVHQIAALLYPFIALGIPIGTYLLAMGLKRRMDAAVSAGAAFAVAVWLDFWWMELQTVPVDVLFQRMLLVVALGLIAAGGTHRATRDSRLNAMLLGGAGLWLLVVVATLFGYV